MCDTAPHTCVFIWLMELKFLEVFMTPSTFPTLFQFCAVKTDKTLKHIYTSSSLLRFYSKDPSPTMGAPEMASQLRGLSPSFLTQAWFMGDSEAAAV